MLLVDDLLLSPIKGLMALAREIQKVAEKELYDEGNIKAELLEWQTQVERGAITEEEYAAREADLLERLRVARSGQMEQRQHVHTAGSSSITVETRALGDAEPEDR